MYDVIISGTGPAGAMAARVLAKAGVKVIAFDKAKLPWRKPCGGGVPEHVFSQGILDYTELKRENIIDTDTKNLYLRAPNEKELLMETPGETVVDRKIFDQFLREKALEVGAIIQDQTSVQDLIKDKEGFIQGVKIKDPNGVTDVSSKIVIVADGVGSKLVVKGGLRKKWEPDDYAICAVAIIEGYVEPEPLSNSMQIYIDDIVAPNSYAWLFPMKKNRANIGIGIWKKSEKRPMEFLMRLVKQPFFKKKLDEAKFKFFWKSSYPIPIQGVKGRSYGDGVMGVGDCMGFVAPIIGEGIFSALLTGKLAAETAIKALELGDYSKKILKDYQKAWMKFGLKEGYEFQRMMRDAVVDNINENFNKMIDWALQDEQNKKLLGEMFVSGTSLVGNIPPELISKLTNELLPTLKIIKK
ncbi:MAG TPA: NAD(P)/FAD-dependent oxidoreductase [Candidatus Deferrimicrobium sp.]|nr:NAD(P)/FAD-dependent oxidoreductase [Candidatus Deferrimicrobium sp.]